MMQETATARACEQALKRLLRYCRSQGWIGYDPYDGLNSTLARTSLLKRKLTRTALIQIVKRSPVNLRPLIGISKDLNPKGVALAARALILLANYYGIALPDEKKYEPVSPEDLCEELQADLEFLFGSLSSLRSHGYEEACWGYNFDWQSRAFFAPRGTPNVVCTVFAAHAYIDWYEASRSDYAFEMARSSCRFLLDRLNRTEQGDAHCFSYTPLDHSRVHNVNMLAAELLARAFDLEQKEEYRRTAERAVRYTLARQRGNGAWPYGEATGQSWVDNFHTGFVLVSLKKIIDYLGTTEWTENLSRGLEFYEKRFFLADSTPKYYHNKLYPIDVHSAAQAVITFAEMINRASDAKEMATRAVRWAINNLQDPAGFFYFQRHRFYTIKIPYMRWAQAWMLYALSLYLSRTRVG